MSKRPIALVDQFLEPPDFEKSFNLYAQNHKSEQTIAFLDGACTIFGIIEEMLFAKMKDGSRWTETQERAYIQIAHFVKEKGELLDRIVPEFEEVRDSLNLPDRSPYTSIAIRSP